MINLVTIDTQEKNVLNLFVLKFMNYVDSAYLRKYVCPLSMLFLDNICKPSFSSMVIWPTLQKR